MKCSAKEIADTIENIVDNRMSAYLTGVKYLSRLEFENKNGQYLYYFWEESANIQQRVVNVTFTFMFLDVSEGRSEKMERDLEIKSDMLNAASIFFNYLQTEDVLVNDLDNGAIPVTTTYGDGYSGVQVSLPLQYERPCI